MNKKYACYCGLYCGNCAVKVKVEPVSEILYDEMKKAGFEEIIHLIPDGDKFWSFLKGMEAWSKLQDERQARGFTYADENQTKIDRK